MGWKNLRTQKIATNAQAVIHHVALAIFQAEIAQAAQQIFTFIILHVQLTAQEAVMQ